jgi:F-type H+-transporting ATPase subunit epsilon
MADTFQLEVATPERLLLQESVTEAQIPASEGMIGVLPEHAPLLSELGTGELSYSGPQGRRTLVVSGGWVQILNNYVRVLAERAEISSEIDHTRADAALKRAQERLALPASAGVDVARALNALRRAEARLAAARSSPTSIRG